MVTLEALAYLARCQPQKGHGYRPVKRVYLLQVGAAAGGTAGSVGLLSGTSSGCLFTLGFLLQPFIVLYAFTFFFLYFLLSDFLYSVFICSLVEFRTIFCRLLEYLFFYCFKFV